MQSSQLFRGCQKYIESIIALVFRETARRIPVFQHEASFDRTGRLDGFVFSTQVFIIFEMIFYLFGKRTKDEREN